VITEEDIVNALEDYEQGGDFDAAWNSAAEARRRPSRRWIAGAALALAAAAVLVMVATIDPTRDPPVVPVAALPGAEIDPADYPEDNERLDIEVGRSILLTLPRAMVDVALSHPEVADIERPQPKAVLLHGLVEGRSRFEVELEGGHLQEYLLTVSPPGEADDEDSLDLVIGEVLELEVDPTVTFATTGDPDIAAVEEWSEGLVVLRGIGPGVTDLTVLREQGMPYIYGVVVR